jgi:hypothetical protein
LPAATGPAGSLPLFLQLLSAPVHAKRLVNTPDDEFEREADSVSEAVVRRGDGNGRWSPSQRPPDSRAPIVQPPDGGTPLNGDVRSRVEPVLGADLGAVRVHNGPAARDAADTLGARAFTHKNHIWLGSNQRADDTKLLAHEATHVVHQSDGFASGGTASAPSVQRTPVDTPSPPLATTAPSAASAPLPGDSVGTLVDPDSMSVQPAADSDRSPSTAADARDSAEGAGGGAGAPAGSGEAEAGGAGEPTGAPAETRSESDGEKADGGGGVTVAAGGGSVGPPVVPETGAGTLETGDLVLIDVELAEHQRWAGALGRVGEASSLQRAEFIAEAVGSGFISGAASGAAMGLGIGLVTRAVPAIGPVIGGALALHGLVSRDWAETGATIGRFGEGSDTYETLANTIASVSAVIDVVSQVLTVINGIVGVVQIAAAVIAGGAVVLAFFTFGATLGIAAVAADVVGVCEEITVGINLVTSVLDTVNAAVLQPCVALFRALHTYTTQADPREVEAQGRGISTAASASGAALGAWAGGRAAHIGGRPAPAEDLPPSQRPPHETPPPAAGDGPTVHFQEPVTPTAHPEGSPATAAPLELANAPGRRITDDQRTATAEMQPASTTRAREPEIDARTQEILEDFAEHQRLPSGAPLGEPELGNLPGPPGSHLRRGERDPGNYAVPPAARSRVGRSGRREGLADLGEAVASGTDTPRTAAARETLTPDQLLELTDPAVRRADPERARDTERAVEASHVPGVATEPHDAHKGVNVEIIPTTAHREGIHGGDTTRPLETSSPNPDYQGRPGFHPLPERSPSTTRSDAGHLQGAERDAAALERNFPGARQSEIDAGRQWLADRRAELRASGSRDFDTPRPVGEGETRSQRPLSTAEFEEHAAMAEQMGMPREQIQPGSKSTAYLPGSLDTLLIGPDINPLPAGERPTGLANPANAALEPRAVLGHEIIGHREAELMGQARDEPWHEELQASARAALHTPELTREQSWLLLQDAAARRRFQTREGEIYINTERYGAAEAPGPRGDRPSEHFRPQDQQPTVIVDWDALGAAPPGAASGREMRMSPQAGGPSGGASATPARSTPETATTPHGNTPSTSSTFSAAAGAARAAVGQQPPGGPQPGPGSPTWGTRAHQVGELFLPQVFGGGGEAPTYAQQQAAHRARFTGDNQPAEGVERVNPEYPPPPATPAQITAIQNEIMNLLMVRAAAEQEAENQSQRADRCEANQAPIRQTVADTTAGISAVQAHDAAVARREAVNQEQQQRQAESQGLVAGYSSRATGLTALSVPLAAWEGFTSLASHLPGEAGDSMLRMNQEARRLQDAFTQMGAQMLGVDSAGPANEQGLQDDRGRLEETSELADVSDQQLHTANAGAEGLQDANAAALAEATRRQQAATDRAQECGDAAAEREQRADSLAEQLRAWAAAHAQARRQAIAATEQRLASEGRIVVPRSQP